MTKALRLWACFRAVSNDQGCPGVLFDEVGFAVDSLLEKQGFELVVPLLPQGT